MFCQKIEIQAIVFIYNTNPRFPPFLLHVRCKSGVTFIRRNFRDEFYDVYTSIFMLGMLPQLFKNVKYSPIIVVF